MIGCREYMQCSKRKLHIFQLSQVHNVFNNMSKECHKRKKWKKAFAFLRHFLSIHSSFSAYLEAGPVESPELSPATLSNSFLGIPWPVLGQKGNVVPPARFGSALRYPPTGRYQVTRRIRLNPFNANSCLHNLNEHFFY
ncbi:hypothetical protein XENORESO_000412 [Xenotaenia resolanae]|uniref:Uncharacterized protein n=1 Tax=Xenotaenia resolanae TaxID=208358 RepID=A0ABV0VZN7_9TELE